jgi:hypothetical protein
MKILRRNTVKTLLTALILGVALAAATAAIGDEKEPSPDPRYTPQDVVRIQLEALQRGDIETTFRFASPANREQTGPIERFSQMINSPPYSPMIGSMSIEYAPLEEGKSGALQRVTLIGKGGEEIVYVFYLSKQTVSPYVNCWMTDAVFIESWKERGANI